MKRVLMVAFQFPPFAGSSAVQRTLRFVQHLPSHGWEAIVLSANPLAYEATSDDLLADIPALVVVERAFALDCARHLSIAGRYPAWLARPDRWRSWCGFAVRAGTRIILKQKPDAIWSTFPIPTAHSVGMRLQQISGLPWLADFRDPMAQHGYPRDPLTWKSYAKIERETVSRARFSIFTTPGAAAIYAQRYPEVATERVRVIENGYDEETFASLQIAEPRAPLNPGSVTLLHSGALYASERDPTQLFVALGALKRQGLLSARRLRLRFRASGQDDLLTALGRTHGVEDLVQLAAPISYRMALEEMVRADGLLLMQASNCNQQIPAKLYEYLRSGRPILGLTDAAGDTAAALKRGGVETIAPLDDAVAIQKALMNFMESIEIGTARCPDPTLARQNARDARAGQLAALFDAACDRA